MKMYVYTKWTIHVLDVLHKPVSCLVTEFESWKICIFIRNATNLTRLQSFSRPVLPAQEERNACLVTTQDGGLLSIIPVVSQIACSFM